MLICMQPYIIRMRIVSYLRDVDADVFGIDEVTGNEVYFVIVDVLLTY